MIVVIANAYLNNEAKTAISNAVGAEFEINETNIAAVWDTVRVNLVSLFPLFQDETVWTNKYAASCERAITAYENATVGVKMTDDQRIAEFVKAANNAEASI